MDLTIAREQVASEDVRALLAAHLAFASEHSPPEHSHAFDAATFRDTAVVLYGCRRGGELVGIGALKRLEHAHAELKSMHVAAHARGQGIARALLEHLLTVARDQEYERVSLETGSTDAFAPARALYRSAGFEPCEPFGSYTTTAYNTYMSLRLA